MGLKWKNNAISKCWVQCARGNKIAPLWHKGRAKRGPRAEGVQFYCPSSTEPSINIIFTLFYCLTIEQFLMQPDPGAPQNVLPIVLSASTIAPPRALRASTIAPPRALRASTIAPPRTLRASTIAPPRDLGASGYCIS